MENIRPSADLRNKYSEISKLCRETKEPIFITVNGRGDTVLMGMAEYKQLRAEIELMKMLAEGEEDVQAGKVSLVKNSFDSLRKNLTERK